MKYLGPEFKHYITTVKRYMAKHEIDELVTDCKVIETENYSVKIIVTRLTPFKKKKETGA